MTTPPITSTTEDLIAELERFASDAEIADDEWISGFTAGDFRALLAERADLKQQLVAAGITADNCSMFRKDAERYQWLRENRFQVTDGDMHGPGYPRLADFSFDLWAKRPSTHNVAGLDAAIDAAMNK